MRRRVEIIPPVGAPTAVDVNQQDYSTQATAALGLQARVPGQLQRHIGMGVTLDDWTRPEFWWLRRGIRGYAGSSRAGFAGERTFFALQCLPGSLLVVERVYLMSPVTAQYVSWGIQAAQPAAAAATSGVAIDSRATTQGGAARWVLSGNAAPTPPTVPARSWLPIGQLIVIEPDAVVSGGNWFSVVADAVNLEIVVTVIYRERPILPSEE